MAVGRIRHLFPGGNTPQGFFSYYNYVISSDAARIFIFKGGPGTGKSTFMRKMGEAFAKLGYDMEFHHCSSDNRSLDGIVIPKLQVAFIDGTAPHIVDPKNPGCVEEILHLGEYWNEKGITSHREQITACNAEIGKHYQHAYRFLQAAKLVYDDTAALNREAVNGKLVNEATENLLAKVFDGMAPTIGCGKIRKLFASAITPDGAVHYLDSSVWYMNHCHVISGSPGTGKSTVLQKIIDTAVYKGLDIEVYYCPLAPEKPEHVVIPLLNTAITTSAPLHSYDKTKFSPASFIDMDERLTSSIVRKHEEEVVYNQQLFKTLWDKTIRCIQNSKRLHDQLETYYIPYMNFQGVQRLWDKTYSRVLSYQEN